MDDIRLIDNWTKAHTQHIEQWVDVEAQWVSDPNFIHHDYLYSRGMGALAYRDTGYNTICGNTTTVYLGTVDGGIKYFEKKWVTTDYPIADDIVSIVHNYLVYPMIWDFNIRYLHCNDDYMGVLTRHGINVVKITKPGYISFKEYQAGYQAYKCFVTSYGDLYYTLSGTNYWRIQRTENPASNNNAVSLDMYTGDGILPEDIKLTDLYITEGTAKDHTNDTVFCATTSGAYIIDLGNDETYSFYGTNGDHNFTSIWADPSAGVNQNKVYVSSATCLYVIKMESKAVYSRWTSAIEGSDGKPFSYTTDYGPGEEVIPITYDVVDINKI